MATNFGGVHVGCHCWVPLLGAIAGCHAGVPLLGAIAGCHCLGAIAGVPLLGVIAGCHAGVPLLGAMLGCHCWVPLLGCHCWVPLLGCHCSVPLWGAMAGCHCWMLATNFGGVHVGCLREKIDQSVTPFSAAPFSTLITHILACAIWGLCWYNFLP